MSYAKEKASKSAEGKQKIRNNFGLVNLLQANAVTAIVLLVYYLHINTPDSFYDLVWGGIVFCVIIQKVTKILIG